MRTHLGFAAGLLAVLGTAGCSADPTPTASTTPGLVAATSTVSYPSSSNSTTYSAPTATWTDRVDTEFPSSMIDTLFLRNLDEGGVLYATPGQAVDLADSVCRAFDRGADYYTVATTLSANVEYWTPGDAGWFTGSAIGAYCPEHEVAVPE